MNKGLVMDVKRRYSIVLTEDMTYIRIKNRGALVKGMSVSFTDEDIYHENNGYLKLALAACLVIMMVIGMPMVSLDSTIDAYAVVSLDINPSFQFEVDVDYIVISAEALNDDAEELLQDEWLGKPLKVVLKEAIAKAAEANFLTEERDVVMLSYALDEDDDQLEMILDEVSESDDINFIIIETDSETVKEAEEDDVSIGRKALSKELDEDAEKIDLSEIEEKVEAIHDDNLTQWIDNKARVEQMKEEKKKEQAEKQEQKKNDSEDEEKTDITPEDEEENLPPGLEKKSEEENLPPGLEKKSEEENLPPGLEKKSEEENLPPGLEKKSEEENLPPGLEKKSEEENLPPGLEKKSEEEDFPPGQEKKDDLTSEDEPEEIEEEKIPPGQEKKDGSSSQSNGNADKSKDKSNNGKGNGSKK